MMFVLIDYFIPASLFQLIGFLNTYNAMKAIDEKSRAKNKEIIA